MGKNSLYCIVLTPAVLMVCLIGAIAIVYATARGVGLSEDSAIYFETARNLAAGRGYVIVLPGDVRVLMTHFPPFFPTVLALPSLLGIDPVTSARWLNVLLFVLNTSVTGVIIFYCSGKSLWTSLAASLLLVASESVLSIHAMAWSEPLFIYLAMSGLICLSTYLARPQRKFLFASGCLIGLAFVTRYVGVALVGAGALAILFLNAFPFRRRIVDAVTFVALCCAPMVSWLIVTTLAGGIPTVREFEVHLITSKQLTLGWNTLRNWLLPNNVPDPVRSAALLVLVGLALLAVLKKDKGSNHEPLWCSRFIALSALFVACYTAVLIISMSFFDPRTRLDSRILSPVYVFVLLCAACSFARTMAHAARARAFRALGIALTVVLVGLNVWRGAVWAVDSHSKGLGYSSVEWKQSELIGWVKEVQPDAELLSNECAALYLLTGRQCVPEPTRAGSSRFLVWFSRNDRGDLPSMASRFALRRIAIMSDGVIYTISPRTVLSSLPPQASKLHARYENGLSLAGYQLSTIAYDETRRRQTLDVTLYWQIHGACTENTQAAVKLVNAAKTVWASSQDYTPCKYWRDGDIVTDVVHLEIYPATPPGAYDVEVILLRLQDGQQMSPLYGSDVTIGPVEIGFDFRLSRESLDVEHQLDAQLAQSVRLIGYNVAGGTNRGEMLSFTAFWECLSPMEENFKVFLHVVDREGKLLAQKDGEPVTGFYPTSSWRVGQIIRDQYDLFFADESAAAAAGLRIGMYSSATGERLPVTLPNGEQPADRAISIP